MLTIHKNVLNIRWKTVFIFHSVLPPVLEKKATVLNPFNFSVERQHVHWGWQRAGLFISYISWFMIHAALSQFRTIIFFVGTLFVYKNECFYLSYINFILAIWRDFWCSIKYFIRFLRNGWSWRWFILYTIINCHFQLMVNIEQWDWKYFLKTVFHFLMMYGFCHDFEVFWKNAPNNDSWRCQ